MRHLVFHSCTLSSIYSNHSRKIGRKTPTKREKLILEFSFNKEEELRSSENKTRKKIKKKGEPNRNIFTVDLRCVKSSVNNTL